MTTKEMCAEIMRIKDNIFGNGKRGLVADVEVLKNNLKYIWMLLSVCVSLNLAILVLLLKK